MTEKTQDSIYKAANETIKEGSSFTKKLFTNSAPDQLFDSVKTQESSLSKLDVLKKKILRKRKYHDDEVLEKEQKQLDQIIKTSN